jgi:hypothetical protein
MGLASTQHLQESTVLDMSCSCNLRPSRTRVGAPGSTNARPTDGPCGHVATVTTSLDVQHVHRHGSLTKQLKTSIIRWQHGLVKSCHVISFRAHSSNDQQQQRKCITVEDVAHETIRCRLQRRVPGITECLWYSHKRHPDDALLCVVVASRRGQHVAAANVLWRPSCCPGTPWESAERVADDSCMQALDSHSKRVICHAP